MNRFRWAGSPRRSIDGNLDDDDIVVLGIDGKVDVAATAAVQLADDPVALENRPRFQERWRRQVGRLIENLAGLAVRQFVDPDDLDGEVVRAAPIVGFLDDRPCGAVQVLRMIVDRGGNRPGADMVADAISHLDEDVAFFEMDHPVVDLDLGIHAQRPAEVSLFRRYDDPMIVGELLEGVAGQAIEAGIADMEDVSGCRLHDHHAQRADIALVPVVGVLASAGLRMEPGIGGIDDALRRGLYRPCIRCAVVVRQEALDGRLARHPADAAAADSVRQRHGDALRAERRLFGDHGAVKVLIGLLAALV